MAKIKTVIVHVGLHKTATTSIQKTLFFQKNNTILDEKGFIYPKSWYPNHSIPVYSLFCDNPENYHINIKLGYSKEEIKNINQIYSKKLVEEIENRKSTTLIISGEDISILNKNNLIDLKEFLKSVCYMKINIRVIVYVRNPASWIVSLIQEKIKNEIFTLERALIVYKTVLKDYFRIHISNLIQVFGKDAVEIYCFEDAITHKFGPVGHFLSVVGFNNKEISKFNIIKSNESVSQVIANLISYINEKVPLFKNGKINKERFWGDIFPLLKVRGRKFDISYTQKKELLQTAMEDIKWLKDNVGIDYSDIQIKPSKNLNKQLNEETIGDIKKVFPKLSCYIKLLTVEYFENQLKEAKDNLDKELIVGMLEGMYNKEYKNVNIQEFPIAYRLTDKPINISKDVIEIENTLAGWVIESVGSDPFFSLPKFDSCENKGILFIKIRITSPINTIVQVFYKSDSINFDEDHSIMREINKGYNELIIEINESKPIKAIRLDPGNVKGIYLIHALEVRSPKS
ncbi:hypothetical protein [Oceanirhabdus seepicola]|uniref:Sulfotransferase domain-containing protein n=1 Tax=Oceanirhabdus seepicola TaxID=2828781 RepID=A0A9J6P075_9CLOT|nr:hypothetical protein [Oceanirhabdus seepicola]MCM1989269.1 hypothetical protein [Oceanirhabdus seepicola]